MLYAVFCSYSEAFLIRGPGPMDHRQIAEGVRSRVLSDVRENIPVKGEGIPSGTLCESRFPKHR
jgi:hypothetical protein